MGQLFVMLAECAEGRGLLIQKYGDTLDATLCNEMIEWLAQPRELQWMVAGIEPGIKVAHKSGWIDDMQSDTGIVYSPNRRYVAAIYVWREHQVDKKPSPYLADVAHTIYSFFNPELMPHEMRNERSAKWLCCEAKIGCQSWHNSTNRACVA